MERSDICIAGGGIIGLSLALELDQRGLSVTVLDRGQLLAEASTAAAGMLAASDPENPGALRPLSNLSLALYPAFLDRLRSLSGIAIPFHTVATLQSHLTAQPDALSSQALALALPELTPGGKPFTLIAERSLDPRNLAAALRAAVESTSIDLLPHTPALSVRSTGDSVEVRTASAVFHAAKFVNCTGAWAADSDLTPGLAVTPRKGQMLAIALPRELPLHLVIRTHDIYIVPRTTGPMAGRAIIGATIEDVGFDKTVSSADIARLRSLAAALLPPLATATELESWAGLRPSTPDGLPFLGEIPGLPNQFAAVGHYRNGILLAPATAHLMAQILTGEQPDLNLGNFSPARNFGPPASPSIAH